MKRHLSVLFVFGCGLAHAYQTGAPARTSGAPGDQNCTACHGGTALNRSGGSVSIHLPGTSTYTPGVKQRLTIQISDSAAKRYGFELSARLVSNLSGGQAGSLAAVDSNVGIYCDNGRGVPCSSATTVQFATHTLNGERAGSSQFSVDWTPPSTNAGNIRLYVAGNAANGNGSESGDHIYTSSIELSPVVSTPVPSISSTRGVVNGASFEAAISDGSWITITGSNLATTTRTWTANELRSGTLPTILDEVTVTVDGKPAFVEYVSPTQINALAPADTNVGPVEVRVITNGQPSAPATVTLQAFEPALFTFDGKYLAATHANSTLLGKPGLFASAPTATTPAKPGETIVLYGTGFGATDPAVPAGQVTNVVAALTNPVKVTIGGVDSPVVFAGLVPPFARLYQFNITVPDAAPDGDQPLVIQIGGVNSLNDGTCCLVTVQR